MKFCFVLLSVAAACGQQATTHTYDVNGRPVPGATRSVEGSDAANTRATSVRNLNGREIPIESVEQRVVRESGGVRIIERIVKRYDANGRPGPAEKTTVEERKNADGTVNTVSTVYREDLNGRMALAERSTSQSSKSGSTISTDTTVERPTLNGIIETVERRQATRAEAQGSVTETTTAYRRDVNGRFGEALREVRDVKTEGDRQQENTAIYEASPNGGAMTLLRQIVASTTKRGNQTQTEMSVYELESAGKVASAAEAKPVLRERRVVERSATGAGTVESVVVRTPLANDPQRLGPAQKVEETVCTGCKP